MSVMDMLAANEAAEAAAKNGPAGGGGKAKSGKGKGKGKANGGGTTNESNIRTAPASEVSSTADASGDEVDAMDEDMMADDGDESEEDSEEEDEDEQHARLLGFVGTLGEQAAAAHQAAEDRRSSQLLKEGEFNPTAVAASSGAGSAKKGAITMEVREKEKEGSREGPLVIRASLVAPFCFFRICDGLRPLTRTCAVTGHCTWIPREQSRLRGNLSFHHVSKPPSILHVPRLPARSSLYRSPILKR